MLNEHITKAQQTAAVLADDLMAAYLAADNICRPEGRSRMDKALTAYLSDCLKLASDLAGKLHNLGV